MRYLSLFSGIGGNELGIQKAYDYLSTSSRKKQRRISQNISNSKQSFLAKQPLCVGYSEIDKYAIQVYKKQFPNHKNYGDITKINAKDLPDFDLIVGGFPCQAFSIAGKRQGFNDTRGTLFFDIARIVKEKHPKYILLENVKGLLSHDSGRTFKTIISALDELGYDIQWQVLNAKNFGVPQNRERVFIVGHLRGTPRPEVFPIVESNKRNLEQIVGGSQGNRVYSTGGVSVTIASQAGGRGAKTGLYTPAIRACCHKKGDNDTLIAKTVRSGGRGSPHGSKQNWDSYEYKGKIRRLTPLECERLMAYPDNWTAEGTNGKISDSQRYKMCGNGVVSNVVKEIVKRIIYENQ